jgi:hypothetical protein
MSLLYSFFSFTAVLFFNNSCEIIYFSIKKTAAVLQVPAE